jgi:vacuolar-type H+-ATPase subunit H
MPNMEEENINPEEDNNEPTGDESPDQPNEPETEPADTTGDDPPADTDKEKGVQKRIDELTRKRRDAERDAEYWRNEALKNQPKEQEKVIPPGKPQVAQFEDYDDYVEALTDWKLAERDRMAQQNAVAESHSKRVVDARTRYDDFDEVMDSARNISCNAQLIPVLQDSDKSADIIYHLTKHPEEMARINALPLHKQVMEIGKLETRFEKAATPPPPKRTSEAPVPIVPVTTAGDTGKKDPSQMSDKEFNEWRRKQKSRR